MGVGQVNDKDASVGRLVVAVVTMEEMVNVIKRRGFDERRGRPGAS